MKVVATSEDYSNIDRLLKYYPKINRNSYFLTRVYRNLRGEDMIDLSQQNCKDSMSHKRQCLQDRSRV